ncbi:MAG: hemolysin III family protein [Desulfotalea sp.]
MQKILPSYNRIEEKVNVISHAIGSIAALAGLVYLLYQANIHNTWAYWVSGLVFGVGMILMLTSSTLYHWSKSARLRKWLRCCDHSMIFLFIAATYTPFTLLALAGNEAIMWTVIIWSIAVVGMIIAFVPFKHKVWIELPLCLSFGWLALCLYGAFSMELGNGLNWLFAGGIIYSVGAVLYTIKKMPFNHAIWHCFVIGGAACHFTAISGYLMK